MNPVLSLSQYLLLQNFRMETIPLKGGDTIIWLGRQFISM